MTWDRAEREWPGCVVLVGLTYLKPDGTVDRLEQFYGQIDHVDRHEGVRLNLSGRRGGDTYELPPQLEAFQPALRGEYRLKSTGEVVHDPDFISEWTISPPADC